MPLFPCCIPASPNWYCSNIGCAGKAGFFLFGGKNSVYKIELEGQVKCTGALVTHFKKVTAVGLIDFRDIQTDGIQEEVFKSEKLLGVSAGEDCLTRIWGIYRQTIFKEHKKHEFPITALVTSSSHFLVISGDNKGFIIIWNFRDDEFSKWCPVQSGVASMALCPHNNDMLCVGYNNGHVVVCNHLKEQIIQVYKTHQDEICSIVWCPEPNDSLSPWNDGKTGGFMLASSSKDKTIKIWNSATDKCCASLSQPAKTRKGRRDDQERMRTWIGLLWFEQTTILSGTNSGELLQWNLISKKPSAVKGSNHNRTVFSISWDQKTLSLITTSMDRQIYILRSSDLSIKTSISSLGGFVYCMASSNINCHSVAYGVGDNMIRIWHTGQESVPFRTSVLWQGIKGKVTSIAFHPYKESLLAFGLHDGRVGVYNINQMKFEMSQSAHKKTVYSISFGPELSTETEHCSNKVTCIYTCGGEGVVLKHSLERLVDHAVDVNVLIRKHLPLKGEIPLRSEVCWHHHLSLVAFGNDNGSIDIYKAPDLKPVACIPCHSKIINCLKWHPLMGIKSEGNDFTFWLASGSNDNKATVTDVSGLDGSNVKFLTPFREFVSHSGRITCIDWSAHYPGLVVFGSYNCTVQVWDVIKDLPVANFRSHQSRVLSVLWSLVDEDIIYSGDEEFNVYRWRISEQWEKLPPEKVDCEERTKKKAASRKSGQGTETNDTSFLIQQEGATSSTDSADFQEKAASAIQSIQEMGVPKLKAKGKTGESHAQRTRGKSLLPLCNAADQKSKALAQEECVSLAAYLYGESTGIPEDEKPPVCLDTIEQYPNLGLYTDWLDTLRVLEAEGANHVKNKSIEQAIQLQLWQSNFDAALKIAMDEKHLTESLVAMSPMAGIQVWKNVARQYADQLVAKGNYHQAASYFVAVGEPKMAIDMFKDKGMFREALVLAKVSLAPDDDTVLELYSAWGRKLWAEGAAEPAAKCYLAQGQVVDAIHILGKKGDGASLEIAAKVAKITENMDLCVIYTGKCIHVLVNNLNWSDAHRVLDTIVDSAVFRLFLIASEATWITLNCYLVREVAEEKEIISSQYWNKSWPCDQKHIDVSEKVHGLSGISFVAEILNAWSRQQGITSWKIFEGKDSLVKSFNESLSSVTKTRAKTSEDMLIDSTRLLTLGILHLLEGCLPYCFNSWLKMYSSIYECREYLIVEKLQKLIFPRGIISVIEYSDFYGLVNGASEKTIGIQLFRNFDAYFAGAGLYYFHSKYTESGSVKFDIKTVSCENPGGCFLHDSWTSWDFVDVSSVLPYICFQLLSYKHSYLNRLRQKIKALELECDITKRLGVHVLEKAKIANGSESGIEDNTSSESRVKEVDKQVEGTSEERTEPNVQPQNDKLCEKEAVIKRKPDYTQFETQLQQAQEKLAIELDKLKEVPYTTKDFSFPDPQESLMILKSLLKKFVNQDNAEEQLKGLLEDVSVFEALED